MNKEELKKVEIRAAEIVALVALVGILVYLFVR